MALRDLTPEELGQYAGGNDSSLIEVDAPNNTVFDEKNNRVLSLPQTLNADETQFIIDRDIDGKQNFFAQQPIEGMGLPKPREKSGFLAQLGRGFVGTFLSLPGTYGGAKLEEGEGLQTGRRRLGGITVARPEMAGMTDYLETDAEEQFRKRVGEVVAEDATKLIERNRRYMAESGWGKREGDGIMYDIGNGTGTLGAAIGMAALTRSPTSTAVLFGAMQKSNIYVEAREAGMSPDSASGVSTLAGAVEATLEKIGLDRIMTGLAGNTAVKRFVTGFTVESLQEGSQQAAEEAITNVTGIRNEKPTEIAQNILYNAALGGIIGGPVSVAVGPFVHSEAKQHGFTDEQATALATYAEENIAGVREDIGEFIDKEVAPLAADDQRAREFMTLMQKFDNRLDIINPEVLTPEERSVFDEYVAHFNESVTDPVSRDAVEQDFFSKLTNAGVDQEQAVGAAKLLGARADAASRALGITPKEWYDAHGIQVKVERTPEEAKAVYQEKLDEIRGVTPAAPVSEPQAAVQTATPDVAPDVAEAAPEVAPAQPQSAEERQAELASMDKRLTEARKATKPKKGPKRPVISWISRKGGINIDSENAQELRVIGLTTRNAPGLFTKGRGITLDNIPLDEFNSRFDTSAQDDGNGYVDMGWLFNQIDEEVRGTSKLGVKQSAQDDGFLQAMAEAGLDVDTATAEEVLNALGPEGDVIAAARAYYNEKITPEEAREILGVQADTRSDIEEAIGTWLERQAVMGKYALPEYEQDDSLDELLNIEQQIAEVQKEEPEFEPETPPAAIEDFGEKIAGARKDVYQAYQEAMQQPLPEDAEGITLSKFFPAPDYETLIANGADVRALAAIKAMREEIPAKPRKGYKLTRWVDTLKLMRQFSNELIEGKFTAGQIIEKMRIRGTGLGRLADKIEFYGNLGYPAFKNAGKDTFVGRIADDQYTAYMNGKRLGVYPSPAEATSAISAALQTAPSTDGRTTKLDIYQITKTGEIIIGKKVGSGKFIDLRGGFKDVREARAYLKENEAGLLEVLERKKNVRPERRSTNDPRKGEDYRMGQAISPEKFASEFGFRGVQFGNYVEQAKRAEDLNNAYDAFLDLANLIKVPSRSISLNGELGLAFGARGKGGKNAPAAHYESDMVVINLTKKGGAGSLGHEWWHALDNFLGKNATGGQAKDEFLTVPARKPDMARPELVEAFRELMKAIKSTDFLKRSRELDKRRGKDYWSTDIELSARAFEAYLIERADKQGLSNDYLANIVSEDMHEATNQVLADNEPYPYPKKDEMVVIGKAFDKLFSTIKTETTPKGVTFYQAIERTAAGDQNVLPGAERISDKQLAERKMGQALKSGKPQKEMDIGLFGDESKQGSLFQSGVRGSITFSPDETIINLFENANPSTLLHEMGHLFLRDMRSVALASKRPMVARDYRIVKEWLGAKGDTFSVEQEEKFARGFEAYLREGKAPKPELQSIFDRFKEWLTQIYKSVRDLDVKINDDIRQVFDRMLGGDFARTEAQILARDAAKVEADYLKVAEPPPSSFGRDARNVIASAGQLSSNIFTPVSSRLGRIHPKLKAAVRKYTFQTGLQTQRDRQRVLPFLEAMDGMTEEDYRMLDFALKNRDDEMVGKLISKYKAEAAYKEVKALLDEIYIAADATGMDLGYLQSYFPRMVRLSSATEYLNTLRGGENWSAIEEAMTKEDPDNLWTDEERAAFVNKYLRGLPPGITTMHKPSFTKERTIDYVKPEHTQYYLPAGEALLQYVSSMRLGIAQREVFGKGENADQSIGAYVAEMVKQGVINHEQEAEVKLVLGALINSKGPGAFVSWVKNVGYVYLMGSPISALTQIQDLAFSLAKNGYYRTAVSVTKAITGRSILKKEDLGIDNVAREFEDETRASKSVRLVFKAIGLEWMDNIGKQTYIEGSFKRLQSQAKKPSAEFQAQLSNIFGDEANQVIADLNAGTLSDNVKLLLYSELSDMQPISLAEMPVGYLRGGNWRSLYMLKTYTIKQVDIYRREVFDKMASGDIKQAAEGTQMLIRLAFALMLMGMGTDALKDLILGRPIDIDNLVMDNILKTMGITKYQIYQSKQDGLANTMMQYFFVPPLYAPVDNLIKDVSSIAVGKENKRTGEVIRKPLKDADTFSYVPGVGKFYYWWVGGGHAKIEKKREKGGD